jgi:hypothetical protein
LLTDHIRIHLDCHPFLVCNRDYTPSVFSNLTHLEVMDTDWDLLDLFPRLPFMPTLTHLAVNSFFDDTTDYDAV